MASIPRPRLKLRLTTAALSFMTLIAPLAPQSALAAPTATSASDLRYAASGKTPATDPAPSLLAPLGVGGRGAGPAAPSPNARLQSPLLTPTPECPLGLHCRFVPAAYQQDSPTDPSNYGNYDIAERATQGPQINSIVIHDTEGSLTDTLAAFQNPAFYASAHYVIDRDGTIYQTVQTKNIAWHAGNWYVNQHSIGIEHVGKAAQGGTDYTPQMYQASARLVRWLASKYDIPLDRQHILGHDNVSAPIPGLQADMHWDPGPFWNWQYYQALLGIPAAPMGNPHTSHLVTISPNWSINHPTLTQCKPDGTGCTPLPRQSANFVYLHTAPSDAAPYLSDPALHPNGSAGTNRIEDWSAKATYGTQYAVAERRGDWTAIWYSGQKGWFRNPAQLLNALPTHGQRIMPRPDLASIPVYGRAYPEAAAYTGRQIPVQAITPMQYTIKAGQSYATTGLVPTDYFWAWYIDSSFNADDHTTVTGQERYFEIQLGQRIGYVKASDVVVSSN